MKMIFDLIPEKTAVVILQTHLLLQTLDHPTGVFTVVILPRSTRAPEADFERPRNIPTGRWPSVRPCLCPAIGP